MRPRVAIARFLDHLGKFVLSLSLMVMRPGDQIEYTRRSYSRSNDVDVWSNSEMIKTGLHPREKIYMEYIPQEGSLLLLGVGGGREAIPLAKMGFRVTGVDFVPAMVEKTRANARSQGVDIKVAVQDITKISSPPSSFDVVWLSYNMYSGVPTRKRRIAMLKRIHTMLTSDGYFLCQFFWYNKPRYSPGVERLRRLFAWLTLGNLGYEKGDMLWMNREFSHGFSDEKVLSSEFKAGGFKILKMFIPEQDPEGAAILVKGPPPGNPLEEKNHD